MAGMRVHRKVFLCVMLLGFCMLFIGSAFGVETEADPDGQTYNPDASCSIFIYMCGSNLESKYGLATQNIDELLLADIPESTNVILETGGTSRWWSDEDIPDDKLQRYIVREGSLVLCQEMDNASMGDAQTLSDFLSWGQKNYPSDRSILVLWDHGGSSAEGVCFDENYNYDFLDKQEIRTAFDNAQLSKKYDLIVLDTCYMGSLDTAVLFSDYAHYMTASQKIVPGAGMDYRTMAESFAGNDDEQLGRILCDSYMEKCAQTGREDSVQLSFYDLSKVRDLMEMVDLGAGELMKEYDHTKNSFQFFKGAMQSRVSDSGKDANLIDLMGFANSLSYLDWFHYRNEIRQCMDEAVLYQVCGKYAGCSGVSVYYPIRYSEENLNTYLETSPAENYASLLREIYDDLPEEMIDFKDSGSVGEDGRFQMELEESSRPYLRGIVLRVWRESEYVPDYWLLQMDSKVETFNTRFGRKIAKLSAQSSFTGEALGLDGHILLTGLDTRLLTDAYSAPVCVNGEDTSYTLICSRQMGLARILYTMLGDGFDELGLPERKTGQLQPGDSVITFAAKDENGDELEENEAFTVGEDGGTLGMVPLPAGSYRCQFIVTDIIGRTVGSDYGIYEITEDEAGRDIQLTEIQKKEG